MFYLRLPSQDLLFPYSCACCGERTDHTLQVRGRGSAAGQRVRVPYCRRCQDHLRSSDRVANYSRLVLHPALPVGLLLGGLAGLAAYRLAQLPHAAAPSAALAVVLMAGLVFSTSSRRCRRLYRAAAARMRRRYLELVGRRDAAVGPRCACADRPAVVYAGFSDGVHTLYCAHPRFALQVARLNHGTAERVPAVALRVPVGP